MRLRFWLHRPSHYKTNLKQGAHIHQPTAWPVPHACAQPYHQGNGSHGQLFRPYWGSSACQESKCRKFKLTVSEVRVRVSCEAGLWKETGRTEARKARKGKEKEPPLLKVKPNLVPRSPTAKGNTFPCKTLTLTLFYTFQCKTEWDLGTRLGQAYPSRFY